MLRHQNSKQKRKGLVPAKSCLNYLTLNNSQIKPTYKEQIKKEEGLLKTQRKDVDSSSLQAARLRKKSAEGRTCSPSKKEDEQLELRVGAIQQYIFGSVSKEERKKYVYNVYKGAIYSLQKLKAPTLEDVKSKSLYLNEATKSLKKFLLLDLDETLIHTEKATRMVAGDNKMTYKFSYRPHLFTFLERMSIHYELYVFTASQKSYAQAVVDKLNRFKVYIKDVLHRGHCFVTKKGVFLKDLRIIQNRGLEDLVIVDNMVESFGCQLSNGVPILEFKGSPEDTELLKMAPFLEELSEAEDVRRELQEKFKLSEIGKLNRKEVETYFRHE